MKHFCNKIKEIAKGFCRLFQRKSKVSYVFLGNGATEIDVKEAEKFPQGKPDGNGSGTRKYSVSTISRCRLKLRKVFLREDARLIGFYAAVRTEKGYLWYTKSYTWETISEIAQEEEDSRRLLKPGRYFRGFYTDDREVLLIAQWKDEKTGVQIRAGHHIFKQALMAHACGAYKDFFYSNTREALLASYEAGYRYFEVDVSETVDGHLVLSHGWDSDNCQRTGMQWQPEFEHMTLELFKQQKIGDAHTMDIYDLKEFLQQHADTCFEIDSHRVDEAGKSRIKLLAETFAEDVRLCNRLLIQAETRKVLETIDEVFPFENYQLLLGQKWFEKIEEGIAFALDHGVETIGMRHKWWSKKWVRIFHLAGLNTMAYTIRDDIQRAQEVFEMGVDTICTDSITPSDLQSIHHTL